MRYEYGIFNADKGKITTANGGTADDPNWAWLWRDPFIVSNDESFIQQEVEDINQERAELGQLETHGPVKYRRRTVTYEKWEDV